MSRKKIEIIALLLVLISGIIYVPYIIFNRKYEIAWSMARLYDPGNKDPEGQKDVRNVSIFQNGQAQGGIDSSCNSWTCAYNLSQRKMRGTISHWPRVKGMGGYGDDRIIQAKYYNSGYIRGYEKNCKKSDPKCEKNIRGMYADYQRFYQESLIDVKDGRTVWDIKVENTPATTQNLPLPEKKDVATVEQKTTPTPTDKPTSCGADETCANSLIKNCVKGTFVYSEFSTRVYTVKGKNSNGTCSIEWGYAKADYPMTGLKMTCSVPATIQTVENFESTITKDKLSECVGPLKDMVTKPVSEIPPDPAIVNNLCKDADCANKLLENCSKGSFTVKRIRDNNSTEFLFAIKGKTFERDTLCPAEITITQSVNKAFVGPKMNCQLSSGIKTLFNVQNFITDKFRIFNFGSNSWCIGELYDLVKDVEF